jgi:MOSC domain-containing protein YiiM
MKLLSVNVAQPREIIHNGKPVMTGIYKEPFEGRVMLRPLNLDGDQQADLKAHGGKYKAAYVYSFEHYAFWERELGRDDFEFGEFGENFTVEGMTEDVVHIGDQFRIGEALVEVTQPRVPCFKLGHKMGSQKFVKQFLHSLRSGFYLRVIEEREVGARDTIQRVTIGPQKMTVREVNHALYFDPENIEQAQRALQIPALSPGWKRSFRKIVNAAANQ